MTGLTSESTLTEAIDERNIGPFESSEYQVQRLRNGDSTALAELFSIYRDRLLRLIDIRMDPMLYSRVDPSDVLQEAYLDASTRIVNFLEREDATIGVWLRLIVLQRLQLVARHHLLTEKRDARREVSIGQEATSRPNGGLARLLADSITSPSAAIARDEAVDMVDEMLQQMPANDRDVLTMRHFEMLTNDEVAEVLGLSVTAASNRYVRALARLKEMVVAIQRKNGEI